MILLKNELILLAVFVVFAAIGAGTAWYFHLSSSPASGGSSNETIEADQEPRATLENGTVVNHVFLLEKGALPDALAVKLGESVEFDSRDGKAHSIAQGGGDEFDQNHSHEEFGVESGQFGPDEAYRVGFTKPGTYHFHDHKNPHIFVTIIVYQPDNASNSTN